MAGPSRSRYRSLVVWGALLYVVLLVLVIGYAALAYQDLYRAPSQTERAQFEPNVPLHPGYQRFVVLASACLAFTLAIWSAGVAIWRQNFLQGLAALLAGVCVTIAGLSLTPWIYFAHDQYAVAGVWVMFIATPLLGFWCLLMAARWLYIRRHPPGLVA